MPLKALGVPWYCPHKAPVQAFVCVAGHDVDLGPYGSKEIKNEYTRVMAECQVRKEKQVAESASHRGYR